MTESVNLDSILATLMPALIGFAGVVCGSFIVVAKEMISSAKERHRHGIYAAIRIVGVLDEYAQKCIDVVFDDGTYGGQPEHGVELRVAQTSTPQAPKYPEDVDWRSVPKTLSYRALTLPNSARDYDRHISFAAEHASPPDFEEVFEARQEGYALLGLEAIEIATALRKAFALPIRDRSVWNAEWDPEAFLRDRLGGREGGAK